MPDEWEEKVLKSFDHGYTEYSSIEKIDGNDYLIMNETDILAII